MKFRAAKMFLYSHKTKFTTKQEKEICEQLSLEEDKVEFLAKFKREALTANIYEIAYLLEQDMVSKSEILEMIPNRIIKELKDVNVVCDLIKFNPKKFKNINFDYFKPREEDYVKIFVALDESLCNHIKALKFRGELSAWDSQEMETLLAMKNLFQDECAYAVTRFSKTAKESENT